MSFVTEGVGLHLVGRFVVHGLWVGVAVAAVLAVVVDVLGVVRRPGRRHAVWVAGGAVVLAAASGLAVADAAARARVLSGAAIDAVVPAVEASRGGLRWLGVAGAAWVLGALVAGVRLAGGLAALRRVVRSALPAPPGEQRRLDRARVVLGIRRPVALRASDRAGVPMTCGVLRPVVLVPPALLAGAPPAARLGAMVHELAHVRRGDFLWNVLHRAVAALLWHQPAVRWMGRRAAEERELCCDEAAARASGGAAAWARSLVGLEAARAARAPALALAAGGPALLPRVRHLAGLPAHPGRKRPRRAVALAALVAGAVALGGVARGLPPFTPELEVGVLQIVPPPGTLPPPGGGLVVLRPLSPDEAPAGGGAGSPNETDVWRLERRR